MTGSHTPLGPGWWQATDGRYYPPHLHPDAGSHVAAAAMVAPNLAAPQVGSAPVAPSLPAQPPQYQQLNSRTPTQSANGYAVSAPGVKRPRKKVRLLPALLLVLVVGGATAFAMSIWPDGQDAADVATGFADGSTDWEQKFISDASTATGVDEIVSYSMPPDRSAVAVTVRSAENVTEGMTKDAGRYSIVSVLEAAVNAPLPPEVGWISVEVEHPLVNEYGEVADRRVILAGFARDTIERIRFDTIDRTQIFLLADELWVHPAFAKGDGT